MTANSIQPAQTIVFPENAYAIFDAAWKAGLLLPAWTDFRDGEGNYHGWLVFGQEDEYTITATWCDPAKPFSVTVRDSNGAVTYCEDCAYADLADLCAALMADDPARNVLAENGHYDRNQTITISQ